MKKGQVLASLDTSDLYAQIKQAQANIDIQQSKLQGLQAGSRPEDITIAESGVASAQQSLRDSYNKALIDLNAAYTYIYNSHNTVKTLRDTYFFTADQQGIKVQDEMNNISSKMADVKYMIDSVNVNEQSMMDSSITNTITDLKSVRDSLQKIREQCEEVIYQFNVSDTDKISIETQKANIISVLTSVNSDQQAISSNKSSLQQAQDQLNLKKAGSIQQDIQAQEAQVKSAEAALQSAQAKVKNPQIVAPISGVITLFDAKVGQYASPGSALISIISSDSFEIDAQVSETDVGKVMSDNKVNMTFDAFPGENFTGTVFYIDPAQTNTGGVIGYKVKISLNEIDPRMKSGLTANIDIETRYKDNVLILPQYAILQNDNGTFVQTLNGDVVNDVPVTLGIQDQSGNIEIVSGVTEGEQVLNIGLKND